MPMNLYNRSRCFRMYSLSTLFRSNQDFCLNKCQNTATCERIGQYPTHFTSVRHFRTNYVIRAIKKNSVKISDQSDLSEAVMFKTTKFTFLYLVKNLFYVFHDQRINQYLDTKIVVAAVTAFLYISDCLTVKDYYGLEGIVSHSVQDGIEADSYSVESVGEVTQLKMSNIFWNYSRFHYNHDMTGRRLAIEVEFTYTRESDGDKEYKADYRLVRRYDDATHDDKWLVTHIDYMHGKCYGAYCGSTFTKFLGQFKRAKLSQM